MGRVEIEMKLMEESYLSRKLEAPGSPANKKGKVRMSYEI